MNYSETHTGRSFVVKFDHGEDLYTALQSFCVQEKVRSGTIQFFGAVQAANVVVGPKKVDLPPEPIWKTIDTPHEIVGFGSVFTLHGEPKLHLHAVFSHDSQSFVGCIRKKTTVFIVVEAIVSELISDTIKREFDSETGLNLLHTS